MRGCVASEVRLVLLNLDHELMDVDELASVRVVGIGGVRHDLVEPVIILDELCQSLLKNVCPVLEVGKRAQDFSIDRIECLFPTGIKVSKQTRDNGRLSREGAVVIVCDEDLGMSYELNQCSKVWNQNLFGILRGSSGQKILERVRLFRVNLTSLL